MNIRDIFVFTSATILRKMYWYMKGVFWLPQIYFQKGVSFCFQNVRIDRESFLQSERRWWKSKRKSPSWPIPSTAEPESWSISAATMTAGTALPLTMEKNVCACRAFPAPCCAGGSVPLSCLWMNRWRLLCFIGKNINGALSAANPFFPAPTGQNTASPAPLSFTAGRKQPATGKGGLPADN